MTEKVGRSSSASAASLTLLTQNLYGVPFAPDAHDRTVLFVDHLNDDAQGDRYDADFVAVQEAFLPNTRKPLKRSPEHPYFSMSKKKRCLKILNGGLALLSKYPIVKEIFQPVSGLRNTDSLTDKGVLLTRVRHPQLGEVDLYTLHLQASYSNPSQYSSIRNLQVAEVLAFIKKHSGDRTVVLAGDFNMDEIHSSYRELMADPELRFIDVMRELYPDDRLTTWREENPYTDDTWPAQRLDYVFLRPGTGWRWDEEGSRGSIMTPCGAESESADACWGGSAISDHYGVFAKMRLVPES